MSRAGQITSKYNEKSGVGVAGGQQGQQRPECPPSFLGTHRLSHTKA